jgi:hypothetical protein
MPHSNKDYLMPSLDPDVSNAQLAHERRLALEGANLSAVLRSLPTPHLAQWCAYVSSETLGGKYSSELGLARARELLAEAWRVQE